MVLRYVVTTVFKYCCNNKDVDVQAAVPSLDDPFLYGFVLASIFIYFSYAQCSHI